MTPADAPAPPSGDDRPAPSPMVARALAAMRADPDPARAWSLEDLRLAAGIATRSRYALGERLRASGEVYTVPGARFRLRPSPPAPSSRPGAGEGGA